MYRKMVCVIIRSHQKGVKGMVMYPGDRGVFKTKDAKDKYQELFVDKAPFLPYAEVGMQYAERTFSEEEIRDACLEHMKSKGWQPKEVNEAFWRADKDAQASLVFPIGIVREKEEEGEDPIAAAVRGVWEETGMRVDPGELKFLKEVNGSRIYELHVSFRRALDCWVVHQAERLTLTDWGRCPHSGVLDLLGIPRIVKSAYCETHGGPIFVKDVKDHTVEGVTLEILSS